MYIYTFVERILDSLQGFAPNIFFKVKYLLIQLFQSYYGIWRSYLIVLANFKNIILKSTLLWLIP